jgi:hypothetical protein
MLRCNAGKTALESGPTLPRPKGTPEKLDPTVVKDICDALELAIPEKCAAELAGIDEMTFHSWMRKGGDGTEPYASFRTAVIRSRAKAVKNLTTRALKGDKGAREAIFFLERRFPQWYGAHVMVGGMPNSQPIHFENDLQVAASLRSSAKATHLIHEALAAAVAEDQARRNASTAPTTIASSSKPERRDATRNDRNSRANRTEQSRTADFCT